MDPCYLHHPPCVLNDAHHCLPPPPLPVRPKDAHHNLSLRLKGCPLPPPTTGLKGCPPPAVGAERMPTTCCWVERPPTTTIGGMDTDMHMGTAMATETDMDTSRDTWKHRKNASNSFWHTPAHQDSATTCRLVKQIMAGPAQQTLCR